MNTTPKAAAFSKLSSAAQSLIVDAVLGTFNEAGPPAINPAVKAEIKAWAELDETPEPVLGDRGQESGVCCGRQCCACEVRSAEK